MNRDGESRANGGEDPVIDRVRAARHRISARFGHDPAKLVAHYMELQEHYRERLVSYAPQIPTEDRAAVA